MNDQHPPRRSKSWASVQSSLLLIVLLFLGSVPALRAEATPTKRIHRPVFAPELAGTYRWAHQYSDTRGHQVFDKLQFEAAEKLVELRWYGVYDSDYESLDPEVTDPGNPDTDIWQITFQADANGQPGAFLYSFSVPADRVTRTQIDTAEFNGPHPRYCFSHTFETPLEFQANTPFWISVHSISHSEGGVFTQSSGSAGAITATGHADLVAADLRDSPASRQVRLSDNAVGTTGGARALTLLTLPVNDADEDGMDDAWEAQHGLATNRDDSSEDHDEDGLTNLEEFERRTNPENADSDGDGLDDRVESGTGTYVDESDRGTSPNHVDSDGDGLNDNLEVPSQPTLDMSQPGTHPLMPDSDRDGLADLEEITLGTDPKNWDTDGDSASDNWEVLHGTNPNDPASPASVTRASLGTPSRTWHSFQQLPTFNGFLSGADRRDATFRAVIDFDAKPKGEREVIFETGGARIGYSLSYEAGNKLVLRATGNWGTGLGFIEGVLRDEWIEAGELEVVWSYEVFNAEGTDTIALWVDGHPISEVRKDLGGDWSGANDASFGIGGTALLGDGLGGANSTAAGFTSGTINLTQGLRYYARLSQVSSIEHPDPTLESIHLDETGRIVIAWNSHPQGRYNVERSGNLRDWEVVATNLESTGFTKSWTEAAPATPKSTRLFYRVREIR